MPRISAPRSQSNHASQIQVSRGITTSRSDRKSAAYGGDEHRHGEAEAVAWEATIWFEPCGVVKEPVALAGDPRRQSWAPVLGMPATAAGDAVPTVWMRNV